MAAFANKADAAPKYPVPFTSLLLLTKFLTPAPKPPPCVGAGLLGLADGELVVDGVFTVVLGKDLFTSRVIPDTSRICGPPILFCCARRISSALG